MHHWHSYHILLYLYTWKYGNVGMISNETLSTEKFKWISGFSSLTKKLNGATLYKTILCVSHKYICFMMVWIYRVSEQRILNDFFREKNEPTL